MSHSENDQSLITRAAFLAVRDTASDLGLDLSSGERCGLALSLISGHYVPEYFGIPVTHATYVACLPLFHCLIEK